MFNINIIQLMPVETTEIKTYMHIYVYLTYEIH